MFFKNTWKIGPHFSHTCHFSVTDVLVLTVTDVLVSYHAGGGDLYILRPLRFARLDRLPDPLHF